MNINKSALLKLVTILTIVFSALACAQKKNNSPAETLPTPLDSTFVFPSTFTSFNMLYCSNGSCDQVSAPPACSGVVTFNDFTLYSFDQGTFFNSITEDISIDDLGGEGSITLTSNQTSHQGLNFTFKWRDDLDRLEVTYGPNCGRLYKLYQAP